MRTHVHLIDLGGHMTAEFTPIPDPRETKIIEGVLGWLSVGEPKMVIDSNKEVMTAPLARDVVPLSALAVFHSVGCEPL
jgi:hypothetical protein